MKKCIICKIVKENSDFNKDRSRLDSLQLRCRVCQNAINRERKRKFKLITGISTEKARLDKDPEARKRKNRLEIERRNNTEGLQERDNLRIKTKEQVNRAKLFDLYNNKCSICGETEKRFLTLDHVLNNGNIERNNKLDNKKVIRELVTNKRNKENYTILCFNCNCSKNTDPSFFSRIKPSHRNSSIKEYSSLYQKYWAKEIKVKYIQEYGGKCQCCGETNPMLLTQEHILEGRKEQEIRTGTKLNPYTRMLDALKTDLTRTIYGLLCYNCNCCEAHGIPCPHKEISLSCKKVA